MMLRRISSVPPASAAPGSTEIGELPGARRQVRGRPAEPPDSPCSSIAKLAISLPSDAPISLPSELSGPGVVPREMAVRVR